MCDYKATNTNERDLPGLLVVKLLLSWENHQHALQAQWNVFNKLHICHCRSVLWMPEDITSRYITKYLSLLENERQRTSITQPFPKASLWPVGCSAFRMEPIIGEVLKAMSGLASLCQLMGSGRKAARWKVKGFQIFNLQVSTYLAIDFVSYGNILITLKGLRDKTFHFLRSFFIL